MFNIKQQTQKIPITMQLDYLKRTNCPALIVENQLNLITMARNVYQWLLLWLELEAMHNYAIF